MKTSPWGAVQHETPIIDGMVFVSTAGHGGVHLDRELNARMPDYMKTFAGGPWYEEDVDWCMPFCVFEKEILEAGDEHSKATIAAGAHKETLRNWRPDDYERLYGVVLQPGESMVKDERAWKLAHAGDLQVVSAYGSWQAGVPEGMVGVRTCVGGRGGGPERYFVVPKADYDERGRYGFIVDPWLHCEVPDFTENSEAALATFAAWAVRELATR